MGILPYWDQEHGPGHSAMDALRKDFNPVSVNLLHSDQLGKIASLGLGMDSELLFVESAETGAGRAALSRKPFDPRAPPSC